MANNHKNFAETTLAAAITDTTGTSITVTSSASFPSAPFIIGIDTECLLVTNVSGTTWTVTRGYESSTAATHSNGASIYHDISAGEADSIDAKLAKAGGTMTGAIVPAGHGTASNPEVVAVVYGTGDPPDASAVPEGTLWIKYTA